jgi:alpha-glucosidase
MGNERPHEISLPLAFLGDGRFKAKIYEDGAAPTELNVSAREVTKTDTLTLKLAPSGGAAARLSQ